MKIGIIGAGKAGQRHVAAVQESGLAEIVAVADPSEAAQRTAAAAGAAYCTEYETMLNSIELDAVIISLPHHALAAAAIAAARHGKHVLLEKPMGISVAEATAVMYACQEAGVRLMVNFVHRFRTEYMQAEAALRNGAVGEPVLIVDTMASGRSELPAWTWDKGASGGGMMMYNGIHSIDRLLWLAGSPVTAVTAQAGTLSYPVEVEDTMVGTLSFANGCLGVVIQHKSDAAKTLSTWETMIYGTRGAIKVLSDGGLELVSETGAATVQVNSGNRFLGAFREFVSAIAAGREPQPSGRDGLHALRVVMGLYEAARTGPTKLGEEELHRC